eukprot:TRINITY_DN19539_c0_g1_i1.p1 TRINITY_DN19539_c0_g1~~TRINITY_DN19539_c0_g1_i1.p1  ORF type:complete len:481 (+),score=60.45 TRINITY_DN19539_c0_g1_i1:230-1672(+)
MSGPSGSDTYSLALHTAANQNCTPLSARVTPDGHLQIGGCDTVKLAEKYATPLYVVCEDTFKASCHQYVDTLAQHYPENKTSVSFATKSWPAVTLEKWALESGCCLDVVSGGELHVALQAGARPHQIYFHGNNKSRQELQEAISADVMIIVDNWYEIRTIADIVSSRDTPYDVFIRLTPGIKISTHKYITTGHLDSKFGFDPDELPTLFQFFKEHKQVRLKGLHAHVGSQACELQPFNDLALLMCRHLKDARAAGLDVPCINLGGGLGVSYTPDAELTPPPGIPAFAEAMARGVRDACTQLGLEPPQLGVEAGRSIVAPSTVALYRVGSTKRVTGGRFYLAVDGGVSDNPRPCLYESQYYAMVANKMPSTGAEYEAWRRQYAGVKEPASPQEQVTVAGKHCEQGDLLLSHAPWPVPADTDDILAFACSGAYQMSMASNYNKIRRPAAVAVQGGKARVMVRRETYEDLVRLDVADSTYESM